METARDNPQGASASEMIEKKRKKAALMRAITEMPVHERGRRLDVAHATRSTPAILVSGGTAIQLTGDADIQITGGTIRLQQMSPAMLREMADEADRRAQRDRDRSDYY